MRNVCLVFLVLAVMVAWCVSPLFGQAAKAEEGYGKAKILLSDAKRAAEAGAEASALEKYGEALIMLQKIDRKDSSMKPEEAAALSEAEAGYIRTLTAMMVKLQNVATQRQKIVEQQGEIIKKADALIKKNTETMKFLLENRDLIEKLEASLSR